MFVSATMQHTIEEFNSNGLLYTAFNNGSGNVSTAINTVDFASGTSSLALQYSFNAGSNFFFSTFKNYGLATQDFSYFTTGFSIQHKGGNTNTTLAIRFWEDHNANGLFDGTDEVFTSSSVVTGAVGWTQSTFLNSSFTLVTGSGNGKLDLNRIRGWDVKIQNQFNSSNSGTLLIDHFQLISSYTPNTTGSELFSGSFTQIWNTSGCKCGLWSQVDWDATFYEMKALCMNKYIVQYSVYNDLSWYANSNLPFVNFKASALDKIVKAAEKEGIKVYFGLYFDENWNSADKSQLATYTALLTKHKQVIDELWNNYGTSTAFGGWYIPQEINDLEWQTDPEKTLLFTWLKDVSDYAHTKTSAPVMIAPFFNLWQPADVLGKWYDDLFKVATSIDAVYPQDGVGITLKDPNYHIPLYFQAIKAACDNNGVLFGATIESFAQQTGWPIDGGVFSAIATDMNRLKTQIWNASQAGATDLIQFEWSYMQKGLTEAASILNSDYTMYANTHCQVLAVDNLPLDSMNGIEQASIFPNPTTGLLEVNLANATIHSNELQIYAVMGNRVTENVTIQHFSSKNINIDFSLVPPGIYYLKLGSSSYVIHKQ
jgi:hypothetical protein